MFNLIENGFRPEINYGKLELTVGDTTRVLNEGERTFWGIVEMTIGYSRPGGNDEIPAYITADVAEHEVKEAARIHIVHSSLNGVEDMDDTWFDLLPGETINLPTHPAGTLSHKE